MTHHYVDTFIPGCDQAPFPVRIEIPQTPGAAPSVHADESADPRGASRSPVSTTDLLAVGGRQQTTGLPRGSARSVT